MQQPAAPTLTQATGPPKPRPVSPRETRVWDGVEAIPAAILAAFVVGVPLRLLLPAETRFMLVSIALATVASTVVLVMPELVVRPAVWLVQGLAGLAASIASPVPALGGRYVAVHGHAHGTSSNYRRKIAKHEAGHAIAAKAVGGSVLSATLYAGEGGGLVQARLPNDPKAALIFLHAGQAAVNSSEGASADNDEFRKVLREVPSKDRSRVKAEAKREARRIVSSRSGEISSYARKLDERGRL